MSASAARVALVASLAATTVSAVSFDPTFYLDGFTGLCMTGTRQTPIMINTEAAKANPVPDDLVTTTKFPVVSGLTLKNVGNGMQFDWTAVDMDSLPIVQAGGNAINDVIRDPSIPVDRQLRMQPVQTHLHSFAEHVVDGTYYAAEGHIVSLVALGDATEWGCDAVWEGGDPVLDRCVAVFGVFYKISEDGTQEPSFFAPNYRIGPSVVDDEAQFPATMEELDLNVMLPNDRSYVTYDGSLTTPPCTEGLRWHVFTEPLTVTPATMALIQEYVAFSTDESGESILGYRTNERFVQPINQRRVWYHEDPGADKPKEPVMCMMPANFGMYGADMMD